MSTVPRDDQHWPTLAVSPADFPFLAPPRGPDEMGRLGVFRVRKLLGAGGMGMVFLAEEEPLDRTVALKVLRPDMAGRPLARERFLREAKAAAAIRSDHVVTIFQVGETATVPFLTMPLLKGQSLETLLTRGQAFTPGQILRIGREIALGLAAAHAQGLIHRDVKPANLFLEAPKGRVKILDFGLARDLTADVRLTESGQVLGTPAYMAPEQARGQRVDGRADLFSLGVVLYRLAAGRLPFQGSDLFSLLSALAVDVPRPVQELNPALPPGLAELITQLLAKKPEERPAMAQEVADRLAALMRGAAAAASEPPAPLLDLQPTPRAKRQRRPRRGLNPLVPSLAVAGLVGVGVVLALTWPRGSSQATSSAPAVSLPAPPTVRTAPAVAPAPPPAPSAALAPGVENWLRETRAMTGKAQVERVVRKLVELNPGFDGRYEHTIRDGEVTEFGIATDHVTKILPIAALTKLRGLGLYGTGVDTGRLVDLGPLRGLKLEALICQQSPIESLEPLRGMPLKKLICWNTRISSLEPLRNAPLEELVCSHTRITSLAPLENSPLRVINFGETPVRDLTPLTRVPLEEIQFNWRREDDAVLKTIPTLKIINGQPTAEFWRSGR